MAGRTIENETCFFFESFRWKPSSPLISTQHTIYWQTDLAGQPWPKVELSLRDWTGMRSNSRLAFSDGGETFMPVKNRNGEKQCNHEIALQIKF